MIVFLLTLVKIEKQTSFPEYEFFCFQKCFGKNRFGHFVVGISEAKGLSQKDCFSSVAVGDARIILGRLILEHTLGTPRNKQQKSWSHRSESCLTHLFHVLAETTIQDWLIKQ